jgi:hypothetical protein
VLVFVSTSTDFCGEDWCQADDRSVRDLKVEAKPKAQRQYSRAKRTRSKTRPAHVKIEEQPDHFILNRWVSDPDRPGRHKQETRELVARDAFRALEAENRLLKAKLVIMTERANGLREVLCEYESRWID